VERLYRRAGRLTTRDDQIDAVIDDERERLSPVRDGENVATSGLEKILWHFEEARVAADEQDFFSSHGCHTFTFLHRAYGVNPLGFT